MSEKLEQLKERLGEVADIDRAASVLSWDQQVNMPPGGNEARGQQLATLSKIAQEKLITRRDANVVHAERGLKWMRRLILPAAVPIVAKPGDDLFAEVQ